MLLKAISLLVLINNISASESECPLSLSSKDESPNEPLQTINYKIFIDIQEDLNKNYKFYGETSIYLKNLEKKKIQLHVKDLNFSQTLSEKDDDWFRCQETASKSAENVDHIWTANLRENCEYQINFTYTGEFRKNKDGFSDRKESFKGKKIWILGSNFEPVYASTVFPYLDDPTYVAEFEIQIRHPKSYSAVCTSDVEKTETDTMYRNYNLTTFAKTSKTSTYLVGFVPSDFSCSEKVITKDENVPVWICSRSNVASFRQVALDNVPKLISSVEKYTGIEYGTPKIERLHLIAVPFYNGSVTANLGLLTFREGDLLCNLEESSNYQKQRVLRKLAYGLSHFWFGNLVTTDWWHNTFLSKALAIHLSYQIPHELDPSLEFDKQFVVDVMHKVLVSDTPMRAIVLSDASSRKEIEEKFYQIFLYKGASIFRMLHSILQDNFKTGLQQFLKQCQFGNSTTPAQFWSSLSLSPSESYISLETMMQSWMTQPGYPIVNVNINNSKLTFTQAEIFRDKNHSLERPSLTRYILETDQKVAIPLSFATSDNPVQESTIKYWMLPYSHYSMSIAKDVSDWIVVNNQQIGYYRVNYEKPLWERIISALTKPNFGDIYEMNRAQIIDDYFNFAIFGFRTVPEFFRICEFLETDVSYYSWKAAFNAFSQIFEIISDEDIRRKFVNHILPLVKVVYNSVSFKEPKDYNHMYTLKRGLVMENACAFGIKDCIENAVAEFKYFKKTQIKPDKNLRHVIYCHGLKHSADVKKDWQFLWQILEDEEIEEERNVILLALGCTTDRKTLNRYLKKSLSAYSPVRPNEALRVFWSVLKNKQVGFDVAFDFFKYNYEAVTKYFSSMNSLKSLFKLLTSKVTNEERFERWMYFAQEQQPDEFHLSFYEADLSRNFMYGLEKVFDS